jgi:hypothetical protein
MEHWWNYDSQGKTEELGETPISVPFFYLYRSVQHEKKRKRNFINFPKEEKA